MGRFARYRSSRAQLSDIEQQGATTEVRRPADTATETTPTGKAHVERSRWTLTVWGLVASGTQLGVGMHPVFTRYLQTYAASPMPTFQMMALMEGLALVAVFLGVQLPRMVPNLGWAGLGQRPSGSGKQLEVVAPGQIENTRAEVGRQRAEARGERNGSEAVEEAEGHVGAGTNGSRLEEVALLHGSAREAAKPGAVRHDAEKPSKHWEVLRAALLIACIATPGETAFLLASRFARAYLLMLVLLFAPMLVAVASTLLFKQALPNRLVPAVLLTTLGAVLAVLGGEAAAVPEVETLLGSHVAASTEAAGTAAVASAGPAGDWKTGLGLGLAAVATFSQAAFQLAVEGTNGVLPEHQVVMAQYCSDAAVACVMSRLFREPPWARTIAAMATADWGVLLAASLFVYAINNFLIQFTIRRLGAAMSAMFMPLRLCSATAASWMMLGERMKSSVQASGLLLVLTSVTWYLHVQYRAAERQASVPEPELHGSQPARPGTVESAPPHV